MADKEAGTVVLPEVALVFEQERTADAAERIAAALEAQRDDPDGWIYSEYPADLVEGARADGWRVYKVLQEAGPDWAAPVYVMRRPRQEEEPETPPARAHPGDRVEFLDGGAGIVTGCSYFDDHWEYLIRKEGEETPLTFFGFDFKLHQIPF
jgi:hypothetical protein